MNKVKLLHRSAAASLIGLIILGLAWEIILVPYKPGSFIFALKVLPLFFPLRGVLAKNIYTLQWAAMFILIYFTEGVVRAMGDSELLSRRLALLEIGLSLVFFFAAILFVRPYKKQARAEKKLLEAKENDATSTD